MDQWSNLFLVAIMHAGLMVHASMKYVDNVNLVLSMLQLGTRWSAGKFMWYNEWMEQDRLEEKTIEHITI